VVVGFFLPERSVLKMDNQGAVYLANIWSIEGRTRHNDVQSVLLQELKEAGVLVIKWIAGTANEADIFTRNLDGPTFQRYNKFFTGGTDCDCCVTHLSKEGVVSHIIVL
jgi:hypothetical protein